MRISDWSSDVCSSDLQEFIDAIERDVRWLGFDWGDHLYHASDYFETLYAWAEHLIRTGKAYVDDQTAEERSEEHTSELQSLMRISYAVFCLKKNNKRTPIAQKSVKHHILRRPTLHTHTG